VVAKGSLEMSLAPLWQRALEQRTVERSLRRTRQRGARGEYRRRKFPRAAVGDRFGSATVVALADTDKTSNERVLIQCTCGKQSFAYVYNLRTRVAFCRHAKVRP
jgi:hypothetical protein